MHTHTKTKTQTHGPFSNPLSFLFIHYDHRVAEYIDHSKHDPEKVVEVSPNGRYAKVQSSLQSATKKILRPLLFFAFPEKNKDQVRKKKKKINRKKKSSVEYEQWQH